MSELRYTATEHLSGCYIKVDARVHGLFIAKRPVPSRRTSAKWSKPHAVPRQSRDVKV
jgi:hypothetical protein